MHADTIAAIAAELDRREAIEQAMPVLLKVPDGARWGVEFLCDHEWEVALSDPDWTDTCYVFTTSGEAEWFAALLNGESTLRNAAPGNLRFMREMLELATGWLANDYGGITAQHYHDAALLILAELCIALLAQRKATDG